MPLSPCNNRGASLLEVVIAMFLTAVGIMAILSLQPAAWRTAARADYLGRASGILYKTLQDNEARITNPCNAVTVGGPTTAAVTVSNQAGVAGDATYTVATTIAQDGANTRAFVVTVTVTWPPLNETGITESMTVTRQEMCRFPTGCPDA
ncbi:MAG: prepilin-type N-terminal cleavage/methylation domain-containing protein [Syntrophales bacterium]